MGLRNGKLTYFMFIAIFVVFYPILPWYLKVAGISVRVWLTILLSASLLVHRNGRLRFRLNNCKALSTIIYLWAFLLSIISIIHGDTLNFLVYFVPWILLMPLFVTEVNTKQKFIAIIDKIIYTGMFVAIVAIYEEITRINVFRFLNNVNAILATNFDRMGLWRVVSFTSHPITYGLYCMFVLCLIFYRLSLPETRRKNWLIVGYILIFASSLFTISRSSIIVIILSQFLLLWLSGYKVFIKRALQVMIVVLLAGTVVSMINPNFAQLIQTPVMMVLAVFSDTYAQRISALGYGGDTSGVADRFILYSLVWNASKGNMLIGHGPSSNLNENIINFQGYAYTKNSIENQILIQLYRFGIIAAIVESARNIYMIFVSYYKSKRERAEWESRLSFSKTFFVMVVAYAVSLFTVMQNEEIYIFYVITCLFLAYQEYVNCGERMKQ